LEIVDQQIHKPESEGGFGPDFPNTPHHETADGHDAKVTRLDVSLRNGSIHVEGDVTVVDAIADSIDVDASFEAEIGSAVRGQRGRHADGAAVHDQPGRGSLAPRVDPLFLTGSSPSASSAASSRSS
jgi:hypothetical protein